MTLLHEDGRPTGGVRGGGMMRDDTELQVWGITGPTELTPPSVLEEAFAAGWGLHLEQVISLFQLVGGQLSVPVSSGGGSVLLRAESTGAPPRQ